MKKGGGVKALSVVAATVMAVSSVSMTGSSILQASGDDESLKTIANEVADESMVLLENNNDVLPLKAGCTISFFANGSYLMSGGGSGTTSAKDSDKVTIEEGLNASFDVVNTISNYNNLTEEKVAEYAANSTAAVIQITRSSSEAVDRSVKEGDWYLSSSEKNMLSLVSKAFDKVIVVLNTVGPIDMAWVDEYQIDGVIYAGTPGQEGGNAVADVNPSGKLTDTWATIESYPSTENIDSFILGTETYTSGSDDTEKHFPYWGSVPNPSTGYDEGEYTRPIDEYMYSKYEEGVYVGYRYYDTFDTIIDGLDDQVYYPFGYGLSYTDFEMTVVDMDYDTVTQDLTNNDGQITVTVTVENTGDVAGKEVVQLYYNAPDVDLSSGEIIENPDIELAAYSKTDLLEPGEKQTITLSYDICDMASYYEAIASYVMGDGSYTVYVGNDVKDAQDRKAGTYSVQTYGSSLDYNIVEECTNLSGLDQENGTYAKYLEEYPEIELTELSKYDYENTKPDASESLRASDYQLSSIPNAGQGNRYNKWSKSSTYSNVVNEAIQEALALGDAEYKLIDVYNGTVDMDTYLDQWTPIELITFIEGAGNIGQLYGGTSAGGSSSNTQEISRLGITSFGLSDGPAQVGGSGSNGYSIAWPTATNMATTWNEELIEKVGEAIGQEAIEKNTDYWLGPSLNIHRTPLCGRNFEYFSEDPIVSGTMAAALTRGAQSQGISVALKHFAANNQEVERWNHYDSIMSERTMREIYLKGFEIVVETADPWGIMSAYGQLNGVHCAKSTELFEIVRDEWGFDGTIMTDWEGDFGNAVRSINSGNNGLFPSFTGMTSYLYNAYMITTTGKTLDGEEVAADADGNYTLDYANAATDEEIGASLTREALENAAAGMLETMMKMYSFADDNGIEYVNPYNQEEHSTWFETVKEDPVNDSDDDTDDSTISGKTALKIAVEVANEITDEDLANVVPAVVTEFKAALEEATTVLNNTEATQTEIDDAFDRLANAIQMLDFIKGDITQLQAFVNKVKDLSESSYTTSTWQTFATALSNAQEVLNNENVLQDEVDESYDTIVRAYLNLRLKPNKDALNDLINKAGSLVAANYTEASWQVLEAALEEAEAVYMNEEATSQEVTEVQNALSKAIDELVENTVNNSSVDSNISNSVDSSVSDSDKTTTNKVVKTGDTTASIKTGDTTNLVYPVAGLALASMVLVVNKKRKDLFSK